MENENNKVEIIKQANYDVQLREFEVGLVGFLEQHNLPSEGIFVDVPERINVRRTPRIFEIKLFESSNTTILRGI